TEGIRRANQLLQMDPLREETYRQMMRLLAHSGQRGKALEVFDTCRRLLDDEFGLTPLPETLALHAQLRAGELTPGLPPAAGEAALLPISYSVLVNPYKGLCAFDEADEADFFGREMLVKRLLARLADEHPMSRFLAVVGPSGSGKSSVVRAGVIPALRRNGLPGSAAWSVVTLLPGALPFDELEIALRRTLPQAPPTLIDDLRRDARGLLRAARLCLPDERQELLLVIDQFEEVFTLMNDPGEARCFLDSLYVAATSPRSPVRIIITLRADFYDRPLMIPDFSELVRQRTEVVTPMTPDELERAVAAPAHRVGVQVEPALLAAIVAEISQQPGALPMMEYALTEVFERRSDHTLTLATYEQIGGALGALARRANEIYERLSAERQAAARQMCLRLVAPGEGTEDTRRRAPQAELLSAGGEATRAVLHAFDRARLLTFDRDPRAQQPTVELAHEAIIREWGQLRLWLDQSRDDVRLQRRLAAAAAEWEQTGRDSGYLLTGSRLAQYEDWATQTNLALSLDERQFLDVSSTEARQRRILRRRVRNVILAAAILVAVVMTVLALFALSREQQAQDAQTAAEREAAVNHSLVLAGKAEQNYSGGKTDLALSLALEAVSLAAPPPEVLRTLADMAFSPGTRSIFNLHGEWIWDIAFSPDGQTVASGSCATEQITADEVCPQGELFLWRVEDHAILKRFPVGEGAVCSIDFSPDGKTMVSGSGICNSYQVSDTDRSGKSDMVLWDVNTGEAIHRFSGHTGWIFSVAFSPDGRMIASGSTDPLVRLWDAQTGEEIRHFEGNVGQVRNVAFSPDGSKLFSVSGNTISVWSLETGEEIYRVDKYPNNIVSLAINPNGKNILTGSDEGSLRLWDAETGEELNSEGLLTPVDFLAISADGHTALFSNQSRIYLWNIDQWKADYSTLQDEYQGSGAVTISPDGQTGIYAPYQKVYLLNLKSPGLLRRFAASKAPITLALTPDGQRLLTGGIDGTLILWDRATGEMIRQMPGNEGQILGLSISPDGKLALAAAWDYLFGSNTTSLILWDLDTGEIVRRLEGFHTFVRSVAFSPDGKTALAGTHCWSFAIECAGGELILFDVATGAIIRTFELDEVAAVDIEFSADGQRALSGSVPRVTLWDVTTGQAI
ncbi:MAG: PQQ-binding-like beta-propeller repeat protein, partial [Chloroflexi bacterium]|nr:PQQ-binding-like beta-propeller repeat protein [Chloroflexota bacterium]